MSGLTLNRRRRPGTLACAAAAALALAGPAAFGAGSSASKQAAPGSGSAAPYEPGAIIRDCEGCPDLVVVPAGSFRMGDLAGGGDVDEGPVRTVELPRPFALARYETTFAEWDACAAAGACRQGVSDIGLGRDRRPVILVTWRDAKDYVDWLARLTGNAYRLPSEAEWEYAARAGSGTRFPWGDDVGRGNANCEECGLPWEDPRTAPAGSFPANAFGIHDMIGNVYEWVADCARETYAGAPSDGSAWVADDGKCAWRTMRGGSWCSLPRASRPANRVRVPDVFHDVHVGFRVARSLF